MFSVYSLAFSVCAGAWGTIESESMTYRRSVGQVSRSNNRFTVSEEESRRTREVKLGGEEKRGLSHNCPNI